MTKDEAEAILSRRRPVNRDPTIRNRILQGLVLLASVDPEFDTDMEFAVQHDQVFAGSFERTVRNMTEDQVLQMRHWGWFCAEESWSHFSS